MFMETLEFSNQSNKLQGFCGRGLDFDFGTRDRILFVWCRLLCVSSVFLSQGEAGRQLRHPLEKLV